MLFVNSAYESSYTQWLREMRALHPEWEQAQQSGRALWWDKTPAPKYRQAFDAARENQKPYPYDVNFLYVKK
jgi:hypothetical protein